MQAPAHAPAAIARHHGNGRISAVLPERFGSSGNASLQLFDAQGGKLGEPITAGLRAEGDFARLRARIDPRLPPGTYEAELRQGDAVRKLSVAVDPVATLRVDPPVLRFSGDPRASLHGMITVMNVGNVAAEIPDNGAVGVYEVNGVETAIGRAYRSEAEDGLRLLAGFIQELRNGYGGLVRLRLEGEKGALPPGSARVLRVTANLPDRIRPGHVYTGVWSFANLNYAVRIEAAGAASDRRA
jgi:hypothetical protein